MKWFASQSSGNVSILVFFITIFCLTSLVIEDNDAFMHLSIGRLVQEAGSIPAYEMFNYPSADQPFNFPALAFSISTYALYSNLGEASLVFFKAATITSLFLVLFLDSDKSSRHFRPVSLVVLLITYTVSMDRFVLRPEIVGMLLMALSILLLNRFISSRSLLSLMLLPFVSLLWANFHSSVNLIVPIFGAFIAGAIVENLISKRFSEKFSALSVRDICYLVITLVASLAAAVLSPQGIDQLLFGLSTVNIDWYRHEIIELRPKAGSSLYAHIAMSALVVSTFAINLKRPSVIRFLLVTPFLTVAFSLDRMGVFAYVVSAPVIVYNLETALSARPWRTENHYTLACTPIIAVIAYLIASDVIRPPAWPDRVFNFGYKIATNHPVRGVADFLVETELSGRVMNDFNSGTYLVWRGYPALTVFTDARGNVEEQFLEYSQVFPRQKPIIDQLYASYAFPLMVVRNPIHQRETNSFVDYLAGISDRDWALVYWDSQYLLYARRNVGLDAIIEENEYFHANPTLPPGQFSHVLRSGETNLIALISELRRNIRESDSVLGARYLSTILLTQGKSEEAIGLLEARLSRIQSLRIPQIWELHYAIGEAALMTGDVEKAERHYNNARGIRETSMINFRLAAISYRKGDNKMAKEYLTGVAFEDARFRSFPAIISLYRKLGNESEAMQMSERLERLLQGNSERGIFDRATGAYLKGDLATAEDLYKQLLRINPFSVSTYTNLGYMAYDLHQYEKAEKNFNLALNLNPAEPNALYGMAITRLKLNDQISAVVHLEKYLGVADKQRFYRQASRMLAELKEKGP